jgi:hypothetical protein
VRRRQPFKIVPTPFLIMIDLLYCTLASSAMNSWRTSNRLDNGNEFGNMCDLLRIGCRHDRRRHCD